MTSHVEQTFGGSKVGFFFVCLEYKNNFNLLLSFIINQTVKIHIQNIEMLVLDI